MAMPGGRGAPSAPPPPRPSPTRPPRPAPSVSNAAAGASVLRWGSLIGGLIIIVDLAAKALQQRLAPGSDVVQTLEPVDLVLNAILLSIAGVAVMRETHSVRMSALAGLIAGLLDALVLAAADVLAPTPGGPTSMSDALIGNISLNVITGVVLAAAAGWFTRLSQRRSGR